MSTESEKQFSSKVKGSPKARRTAARLAAVQSIYAIDVGELPASHVIEDVLVQRQGQMLEDEEMVTPDGVLYKKIVHGVQQQRETLLDLLDDAVPRLRTGKLEPLIASILYAAGFELLMHDDVDAPIIINEYLNITHAFYGGQESKMINGVLDSVSSKVR